MATKEALGLFLSSLDRKSYYEILRLPKAAEPRAVRSAFHAFSLLYHPDLYVDSAAEIVELASGIYKRGVEAYQALSKPASRERYDRALTRGTIRTQPWLPSTRPPPPPVRTLEMIARDPRGRKFADKADRLIAIGRLVDARVALVTACQCEPENAELAERLQFLYEALALEPD